MRKAEENFRARNFPEKGLKAAGVRLAPREVLQAEFFGLPGLSGRGGARIFGIPVGASAARRSDGRWAFRG
jgi:hypothetical protein